MMDPFDTATLKYGEHGVQALLENWERYQGLRYQDPVSLRSRWDVFMRETAVRSMQRVAA